MLAQNLFTNLNGNFVVAQAAHYHAANSFQSAYLVAHTFPELVKIVLAHVAVQDQGYHFV